MRISQVAEATGLNISNIRFYERKGLIGPNREKGSAYRNYTEEDLERLKQIILFRKMDISVETIGMIFEGKIPLSRALSNQANILMEKQQMLQGSLDLCNKMLGDGVVDEVDTEYYLNYVREEERKGISFEKIDDLLEDISHFTGIQHVIESTPWMWWLYCRTPWAGRILVIWLAGGILVFLILWITYLIGLL